MRKTTLLVTAVAIIILLVFAGRLYFSEADFILENPSWNGYSSVSGADLLPIYDIADLSGLGASDTLLVVSPTENYTQEESDMVYTFLQKGGTVIVMDDFGKANSLLEGIDSPITIYSEPLCEYENYYKNHTFPIVSNINPSDEMANVSKLTFNHPALLNVSGSAYTLAYTSSRAWIDYNDNGMLDGQEKLGTYTVVARADYGNGRLLVISDPDLFINSMINMEDNRVFMDNIFKGTVWIDVGHGRGLTPIGSVYYMIKYDLKVQISIILLLIAGGYAYLRRRDILDHIRGLVARGPGNR